MRMRSTGLGKTELTAHITSIELAQDMMIMHVQSTAPVRWHIRTGVQASDRLAMVKLMLKLNFKLLKLLILTDPNGKHPEPEQF